MATNIKDIAKFKLNLKQGVFNNNEVIIGNNNAQARLIAGEGKSINVLRVDSLVGFDTFKMINRFAKPEGNVWSLA